MKIRLTATLLLFILIMASCSNTTDDTPKDSGGNINGTETTAAADGETVFTYPYPDVNYNGAEFRIFNSEPKYNMIMFTISNDMTGEAVNDSIYENKLVIEEKFGINLIETYNIFGGQMLTDLQTEILSGDAVHDVAYMYSTHIGTLIGQGYLSNLYENPAFDIEAGWWNQKLKNDATLFGDNLYYLVSDAHLMSFEGTWCMYFNMNMMNDLGIDYPYDMVRSNQWTLEALHTLAQQGASLNGDESYTWSSAGRSVYGLASFKNLMNALVAGSGIMYVRKDNTDTPYFSFPDEVNLYNKLESIARLTSENGTYITANSTGKHYITDIFSQGRSLLMGGEIKAAANELNNTSFKFGIVPIPKYDSAQESYYSNMLWSTLLMTIPTSVRDAERSAAVMDAMAYLAMTNTMPDYYDRVSYKGLADDDSIEMLNIISETRYLNWGLTYNWLSNIEPSVNSQLDSGTSPLPSTVKTASMVINLMIEKTIAALRD